MQQEARDYQAAAARDREADRQEMLRRTAATQPAPGPSHPDVAPTRPPPSTSQESRRATASQPTPGPSQEDPTLSRYRQLLAACGTPATQLLPCGCNFRQPPQRLPFQDPPLPLGHFKTKEEKEDHHGDDTFHPTVQPTTYLWLHLQTATPVVTWPGPPLTSPQSPPSLPRHPRNQEFNHRRRPCPAFPLLRCH